MAGAVIASNPTTAADGARILRPFALVNRCDIGLCADVVERLTQVKSATVAGHALR
jgi:hypothetical protein